jgi:chemotaxis protein CheD
MIKRHTLFPGEMLITTAPSLISTLLGSCVSVCLWDNAKKFGGINHFLLPGTAREAGDPNRGMSSINMLVRSMLNRGATIETLEAKVFGGCNSFNQASDTFMVGQRNIEMAMQVLRELRIHVKARHTGGIYGRKIVFNTNTGKVNMRLLIKSTANEINEKINKGFGY